MPEVIDDRCRSVSAWQPSAQSDRHQGEEAGDDQCQAARKSQESAEQGVLELHCAVADTLSPRGFPLIGAAMLELLDPGLAGPVTQQLARDGLAGRRDASKPTSASN